MKPHYMTALWAKDSCPEQRWNCFSSFSSSLASLMNIVICPFPHKFLKVAYKKYAGYPLTANERQYLYR